MNLTGDIASIRDANVERAAALAALGFSDRQARFLLAVLQHSGVFVERQYCQFGGIAHGQKTHDFLKRLLTRKLAREIQPGALHRGRLYHVHHKALYAAIGERDNRNRRRAPTGRLIERLMLLDAVLDDREFLWLATEKDKLRYFSSRLEDYKIRPEELPHLRFGSGSKSTLRMFPDKLPVGVDAVGERHVFLYLLTSSTPVQFRAFLVHYFDLFTMVHRWTLRVLVPTPFEKAIRIYQRAVREELAKPLHPSDSDELKWYFGQLKAGAVGRSTGDEVRLREAAQRFRAPRFRVLYRLWLHGGDGLLWNTRSTLLADKLQRGEAHVEFVILPRQYLHLTHLVGVA